MTGNVCSLRMFLDTNLARPKPSPARECWRAARASMAALVSALALASASAEPQLLDGIAAIVDDDVILASELREQLATVAHGMEQRGVDPPPVAELRREVLDRMIVDNLQMQLGERAGVKISDTEINQEISRVAAGRGVSEEQLRRDLNALRPDGYRIARDQLRRDMVIQRVQRGSLRRRLRITEQEIDSLIASAEGQRLGQRQYRALHIHVLPEEESRSELRRAHAHARSLRQALREGRRTDALPLPGEGLRVEQNDWSWRSADELPALFANALEDADKGDWVGPLSSPNGSHILRVLGLRGGQQQIEQTQIRHILLEVSAIRSASQARASLRQFRGRIAAGETFEALARCCSDDHITAAEGGSLGWIGPGDMVETFEQEMRDAPIGEVSKPFETRFGWHILTVEARRQQDVTEERHRNAAYQWLYERRYQEARDSWLAEIQDAAYVDIK